MGNASPAETGTLTVPGRLESLQRIGEFVMAAAALAGLDRRTSYRLRLAVDEVATNSITHGYEEANLTGDLTLRAEVDDQALTVTLVDTAPPFDPRQLERPDQIDLPLEQRDIGGLGVFLAVQAVDEFRYEYVDAKNRSVFVVHRSSGG